MNNPDPENTHHIDTLMGNVLQTAEIKFSLKSRVVLSHSGIQHISPIVVLPIVNKKTTIHELFNEQYFKRIWNLSARFGVLKNKSKSHNYLVNFSYQPLQGSITYVFNINIDKVSDVAHVYISNCTALRQLNTRIVYISDIINASFTRIVYVARIDSPRWFYLINCEYELLQLLSKGYSTAQIAEQICMSVHTIDEYRQNLLDKFKAQNVYQLIANAFQEGYL